MPPERRSEFLTPLDTRQEGPDSFMLLAPLEYYSALLGRIIMVPKGFITDFDSIPRWLPTAYAFLVGTARAPAVVHDWLYQTHKVKHDPVTRRQADAVLYEAAGAPGPGIFPIGTFRKWLYWLGVRVGGNFGAWGNHSLFGLGGWATGPRRIQIWDRRQNGTARAIVNMAPTQREGP